MTTWTDYVKGFAEKNLFLKKINFRPYFIDYIR